jgi:hypothetical protein
MYNVGRCGVLKQLVTILTFEGITVTLRNVGFNIPPPPPPPPKKKKIYVLPSQYI